MRRQQQVRSFIISAGESLSWKISKSSAWLVSLALLIHPQNKTTTPDAMVLIKTTPNRCRLYNNN
jgi:hypothetical protein